jgi:hypothetical protein
LLLRHGELRLLAPLVVLFLAVDLIFVIRRWDRSLAFELVGIVGLTSAGPAALYLSEKQLSHSGLWLWIFCICYMVGTLFYVRLIKAILVRRNALHSLRDKVKLGIPSLTYFCLLTLLLWAGKEAAGIPTYAWTIYLPALVKILCTLGQAGRSSFRLPRVGLFEIVHALIFAVLGVWVMR